MKVLFREAPPSVRPVIEAHLGEEAKVRNIRQWQSEKHPAMWLIEFKDTTMCWLKPQFLEILNEDPDKPPQR